MISLVVINYRSAALAIEAIQSARRGTSLPLRIVVVDNSCDPAEARMLAPYADALVVEHENRGYAAGINAGRPHCAGEVMVVSNPDVMFAPGCLDALAAEIRGDVAAAGPALYWDRDFQWILPPAELHTASDKLDEVLATRAASWMRWRDRRLFRKRLAHWLATETVRVPAISGAVMAISTTVFDELGGFDERFALYFEETDFLRRLAVHHKSVVYVPSARCRHIYDQSASQDRARADALYAASELRYLAKWNGPWLASTMTDFGRPLRIAEPEHSSGPMTVDPENHVVEISPHPAFTTGAGHFPRSAVVDIPAEAWGSYRGNALYMRAVDRHSARVVRSMVRIKTDGDGKPPGRV